MDRIGAHEKASLTDEFFQQTGPLQRHLAGICLIDHILDQFIYVHTLVDNLKFTKEWAKIFS